MTSFVYSRGFAITTGDISTTTVGTFYACGNSVSGILSNSDATSYPGSTVTLTIAVGGFSFTLPELDLSDANATVPFALPINVGPAAITYEATVTGSSGDWVVQMKVDTDSNSTVVLSFADGTNISTGFVV